MCVKCDKTVLARQYRRRFNGKWKGLKEAEDLETEWKRMKVDPKELK